jgi:hypothetical protein
MEELRHHVFESEHTRTGAAYKRSGSIRRLTALERAHAHTLGGRTSCVRSARSGAYDSQRGANGLDSVSPGVFAVGAP